MLYLGKHICFKIPQQYQFAGILFQSKAALLSYVMSNQNSTLVKQALEMGHLVLLGSDKENFE